MIIQIILTSTSGIIFGILQSTLISKIIPFNFVPDIALIILIASAWRYGSLSGEISGFLIGLSFDAMSLAPIGFHAFLFSLLGYLFGRMQDNISPGPVFLPVIAATIATIIKYSGSFLISTVFGLNSGAVRYFSLSSVWELLANMFLAPLFFLLVSLAAGIVEGKRRGFH